VNGGDEQLREGEAAVGVGVGVGGCDDSVAADATMVPAQRCVEVAFARDGVADAEEDLGLAAAGQTLHVHEDDATARRQGHGVLA
jgi:hypothetical protein